MTTPLETAFPLASNFVAAVIRSELAKQGIGCFSTAALSAENFTIQPWSALAIFGNSGALELYAYDTGDTTTADDGGVSCIVVSGRRYKKRIDVIVRDAALSATLTAQPTSPSLGDTYILPAAPSGSAWASKAKTVATYTARGWIFRTPFVGMVVYVSGSDSFYRYTAGGVWAQGLGSAALPDGSVVPKKLANPFALFKVEDQRNAPPGGTPTVGTCYQVGTSPTGAFAGQANKVARWNESAAWEFFAPAEGDTIYRKDVGLLYSNRSGLWGVTVTASGVQQVKRRAFSGAWNNVTGTIQRDAGIDFASTTGKWLRFTLLNMTVTGVGGSTGSIQSYRLGLFADSSTTPIDAVTVFVSDIAGPTLTMPPTVIYQVPDGSNHNYNVGISRTSGGDSSRDFSYNASMLIEELVIL